MLTHLRRIGSLALLLALVGGGLGLPLFDAVMFHSPTSGPLPERALTTEDGAPSHTSVCILGRLAPLSRGLPAPAAVIELTVTGEISSPSVPAALPPAETPPTPQQSRAPPALLA